VTGESEIQKMSGNVCVADHDTGGLTGGRQSMKHAHTETKRNGEKIQGNCNVQQEMKLITQDSSGTEP
jgi:alkaline phosphatase